MNLKLTRSKGLSIEWMLIIGFALLKLSVHLFTIDNYELHRDAYLYYAQSQNLAWGFVAVPPSIAVLGNLATFLFGNTVFALRFFPALIGAINVIIIGLMVMELKGKWKAVLIACAAYVLSPSFLHTNALFQPVPFNQFYWILSSNLILIMVNRNEPKMWLWVGLVFGLAFLNKYSIVFYILAFGMALLISQHRKLLFRKEFLYGLGIGLLVILPNLIWQYNHNWPVVGHMAELRETQLVNVELRGFLKSQLMMNVHAILIWLGAVGMLLFMPKENRFRMFGYLYLGIIFILIASSGKPYYVLGVYPMLFVFGAHLVEKYITKYTLYVLSFLMISMFASLYVSLSFDGIPFVTPEAVAKEGAFRWEDGKDYDIPQDMADMMGWKEIGTSVREVYLNLGEENRDNVEIFANHYGQAGSVMFYGKDVGIPQPITFNNSFIIWAPDSLTKDYLIFIDEAKNPNIEEELNTLFEKVTTMKTIDNPWFRENGSRVFLCELPTENGKEYYAMEIAERKARYKRK